MSDLEPWGPLNSWWPEDFSPPPRPPASGKWIAPILASIAVAASVWYPEFTIPMGCVLGSGDEFVRARWLKRFDPDRRRGRTCSRFYIAWGFWKVVLTAWAMMFVILILQCAVEGRPANEITPPPEFTGCSLVAMLGFLLASGISVVAVVSAWRNRVLVWVGPEPGWAREEGVWPPQLARRRRETSNRGKVIVIVASLSGAGFGLVVTLALLVGVGSSLAGRTSSAWPVLVGVAGSLALMIGLPLLILALRDRLSARMIAESPSICWTTGSKGD